MTPGRAIALLIVCGSSTAAAQAPVTRYDSLFDQVMALPSSAGPGVSVSGITLRRDVATLTLETGRLFMLGPVGGRTVAAAFVGQGKFSYQPGAAMERGRLERVIKAPSIDRPFGSLLLFFADSTASELSAVQGSAAAANPGQDPAGLIRRGLGYFSNRGKRYLDPHLMGTLLNDERNESFLAAIFDIPDGPFLFRIDPFEAEEVSLAVGRSGESLEDNRSLLVNQFHWLRDYAAGPSPVHDWKERFAVSHYVIHASIPKDFKFRASARMTFDWWGAPQPWFYLGLLPDLRVDSAAWEGHGPATVARAKDNGILWLERPRIAPNEVLPRLVLHYRGELLAVEGPWIDLRTSNRWYPGPELGYGSPVASTFDLTFRTPRNYAFASVGERVSSDTAGDIVTSRWVTAQPAMHASFNIGKFETLEIRNPRPYPVTVFVNQVAHDMIPGAVRGRDGQVIVIPRQKNMLETVGEDVQLSLNFFRDAFGDPVAGHFYATEIPGGHGQAFPGLIHFSWITYQGFLLAKGEDEAFRAHEMAHQWWGLGVNPKSYHDAWLSEGFATFASWWYTQTILGDSSAVRKMLKRSKDDLMTRRKQAGPVWLGTRLADADLPQDYGLIVYDKGAWVVRMIQQLMFDPDSGDAAFRRMIRDFYQRYRGLHASTRDFEEVVSAHLQGNMDWFFKSWVYGTGIPTYEWSHTTEAREGRLLWKLRVNQREVSDDFTMLVPVHFYFADGRDGIVRVLVKGPVTDHSVELPAKLSRVVFNESDAVLAETKEVKWR